MPAAFGIGVREFIDQDQLRLALKDGIEIHLGDHAAFVETALLGNDLEAFGQSVGLDPAMGLDHADDDIDAFEPALPRPG